jgi:hypothetical protein
MQTSQNAVNVKSAEHSLAELLQAMCIIDPGHSPRRHRHGDRCHLDSPSRQAPTIPENVPAAPF